jgi:hypothetical protein
MNTPLPPIHETPAALQARRTAEGDAHASQRLQAVSLLPTPQARSRRQVAHLLGGHRETVGRWVAADAPGGLPQMLTMAQAPGKVPLLAPAMPHARRDCLRPPHGFASDTAIGPWLQHAYGLSMADKTGHKFVRYTLRATLPVPRTSPRKTPGRWGDLAGALGQPPGGETSRGPVHAATLG